MHAHWRCLLKCSSVTFKIRSLIHALDKVRIRDGCTELPQGFQVVQDIQEAAREDGHHVHAERQEEKEEETVVSSPDAVIHPWAMMVKVLAKHKFIN